MNSTYREVREEAEKDLTRWVTPSHYFGDEWPDYYVLISRTRDSDIMTNSNWEVFVSRLEKLPKRQRTLPNGQPAFEIFKAGHWLCGWVETLLLHKHAPKAALSLALDLTAALYDWPILDDEHYCRSQWKAAAEFWKYLPLSERIGYAKEEQVSIFAARHAWSDLPRCLQNRMVEIVCN